MPSKSKDSESLIAGLEGIKSIQETITSETEKMNNIIESMKMNISALSDTQAEHSGVIEENTGRIKALESVKNNHDDRLLHVEGRLERLEKQQEFYQRIEDQNGKIFQIMKLIQPIDVTKSACLILLHGIPLEKSINDLDPSNLEDISLIRNSLSKGLSKKTTDFIFEVTKDGNFKNISGWSKGPNNCNFRYGDRTPIGSRNSLMFYCASRTQAMSLEAEMRRALIESFSKRKETEYSALELGIHSEDPKIRALHKFLLYKGRLIVENLEAFDQYRVAYRGGSRRGGLSTVTLALELRASRAVTDDVRREYFMGREGSSFIKNNWTDSRNVRISEPLLTWFPPKNEHVERAERRIVRAAASMEGDQAKEKNIECDFPGCEETFRSRQGLNNHKTKVHNKGIHVLSGSEDEEEEEEVEEVETGGAVGGGGSADGTLGKKTGTTTNAEIHNAEESAAVDVDGFLPVSKKKKKGGRNKDVLGAEKPKTRTASRQSFASVAGLHTPTPLQPKITNFGKSRPASTTSFFPVPTQMT